MTKQIGIGLEEEGTQLTHIHSLIVALNKIATTFGIMMSWNWCDSCQ